MRAARSCARLAPHRSMGLRKALSLQHAMNATRSALPRPAHESAARALMRAVGGGLLELLRGEGVAAFNAFAAQRLADDVGRLQQLADEAGVPGLPVRAPAEKLNIP